MKGKVPHGSNYRQERAKKLVKSGGYASGGEIRGDDGEPDGIAPPPKKKKDGGPVSGAMPRARLDKPRRYATGGGVDGDVGESPKKKSSAKTQVNIVISGKGSPDGPALPPPMPPAAAPMPPAPMPPAGKPPMGGAPQGMPLPGAMRRGGAVKDYPIDAGAGGGKGRLEKAAEYKSHRPKKGSDD